MHEYRAPREGEVETPIVEVPGFDPANPDRDAVEEADRVGREAAGVGRSDDMPVWKIFFCILSHYFGSEHLCSAKSEPLNSLKGKTV